MYDLQLRPELAKLVAKARLPKSYREAKAALAKCESVDECAEWADKAAAIASYARQADDLELANYRAEFGYEQPVAAESCCAPLTHAAAIGGAKPRPLSVLFLSRARWSRKRRA